MAIINITVQSLLNSAQYDPYTVNDSDTVGSLQASIQAATGVQVSWFDLVFDSEVLATGNTLASYGIVDGDALRSANKIGQLTTLQDRQVGKLQLSSLYRQQSGNPRPNYDITLLPTQYVGNTVVNNPHPGGLIEGRPWIP